MKISDAIEKATQAFSSVLSVDKKYNGCGFKAVPMRDGNISFEIASDSTGTITLSLSQVKWLKEHLNKLDFE